MLFHLNHFLASHGYGTDLLVSEILPTTSDRLLLHFPYDVPLNGPGMPKMEAR